MNHWLVKSELDLTKKGFYLCLNALFCVLESALKCRS